jgi:hypothetical protein
MAAGLPKEYYIVEASEATILSSPHFTKWGLYLFLQTILDEDELGWQLWHKIFD